MTTYVPDYYKQFVCIADKCVHCCCIGWEIDIDDDSYNAYKAHDGALKQRIETGISTEGGTPHFVMTKEERCSFLNEHNLCDIFICMGEKSLCKVCTDHPRFRNFYTGLTEKGLGLCCEEAVRIVLNNDKKFKMVELESNGEEILLLPEETEFFEIRQQIFDILETENKSVWANFETLISDFGISLPDDFFEQVIGVFDKLEYMENDMSEFPKYSEICKKTLNGFENQLKNLAIYFVFRHFADALDDGMYIQRLLFAFVSIKIIEVMCNIHLDKTGEITPENLADFVRMYSVEIEYSDKNIATILEHITNILS